MLMLVASADGTLTAAAAKAKGRPVVLAQGGIHAGEIDGKDAGFLALRELLEGRVSPGVLGRVTLVFVPVFNVDGHERVSRTNRPNQVGPEEVGWRVTSQNLNLNRDYVKADAPEMQAMLRLLNEWDPIVYADLHVTDGAQFEHDVSLNVAPTLVGDEALRQAAVGLRDGLMQRLAAQGSLPLDFYPSFIQRRRSGVGLRGDGRSAALLAGVLGRAAAHRRAGRDAFVEAVSGPRPGHASRDRRPARSRGRQRRRGGSTPRGPRIAMAPRSAAPACRSATRRPTTSGRSSSAATRIAARRRRSRAAS